MSVAFRQQRVAFSISRVFVFNSSTRFAYKDMDNRCFD